MGCRRVHPFLLTVMRKGFESFVMKTIFDIIFSSDGNKILDLFDHIIRIIEVPINLKIYTFKSKNV